MAAVRIGVVAGGLALVASCSAAAAGTTALAGGAPKEDCPPVHGAPVAIIDYIDFIQAFDRQYDAGYANGHAIRVHRSQRGRIVLRSTCSFSQLNDRTHRAPGAARDGNTGFLPVGTPIYSIKGWPVECRLTAHSATGKLTAYLAMRKHTRLAKPRACALHH